MDVTNVPETLTVALYLPDYVVRQTFKMSFSSFTQSVCVRYIPSKSSGTASSSVPRFNILVFGPPGAGKSALIQSFMTVLSRDSRVVTGAIRVGGSATHSTISLYEYDLFREFGVPVCIWDAWGATNSSYPGKTLEMLLEGRLASGVTMKDVASENVIKDEVMQVSLKDPNRIHAVIFMVPCGVLSDESELQLTKSMLSRMTHPSPLIVLARVDSMISGIRDNPNKAFDEVKYWISRAARELGVPERDILPGVPYVSEFKRSFELDRCNFRIFERSCQNAQNFCLATNLERNKTSELSAPFNVDMQQRHKQEVEQLKKQISQLQGRIGQLEEQKDRNLCVICMESKRSVAFKRCGHLVCCGRCAQELVSPEAGKCKCPVCRISIKPDDLLTIFL